MNLSKSWNIIVLFIFLMLISSISNAAINMRIIDVELNTSTNNRQVFLGSALIIGDGGSSHLEAIPRKGISIGIDSDSSMVDFYIDYNMTCSGNTDDGWLGLVIGLNGINVSSNAAVIGPLETYKNGTLRIENIEVQRHDALGYWIEVIYTSIIPPHLNETNAYGFGVFSRTKNINHISANLFHSILDNHPIIFKIMEHILEK